MQGCGLQGGCASCGSGSGDCSCTTEVMGNRTAVAVSYPEMLGLMTKILDSLEKINRHLAQINDEEDPL